MAPGPHAACVHQSTVNVNYCSAAGLVPLAAVRKMV
jgi:hypothetical protein